MSNGKETMTGGRLKLVDDVFDGLDAWWQGTSDAKSLQDRMATIMIHSCAGAFIGVIVGIATVDATFIGIGIGVGIFSGSFSGYVSKDDIEDMNG